ncbi:MAG: hypothetical protein EZS28_028565 [Streblomastix strix]|uniref:DM10 domain-containing protein n=1 Tax=Streblomastix strix TaxID=222440 RepID=A0A5J4UZN4_9EUKA|nr:MAG: hypothetical protein EZS28_028565 [Streblomastix strix]
MSTQNFAVSQKYSKLDNRGISQENKIRRHLIPRPDEVNSFYRWDDLNLGMDVEIYEVTYHIVDCDEFTKNFSNRVEIQLNRNEEFPYDPFLVNQEKIKPHPRTTTTQVLELKDCIFAPSGSTGSMLAPFDCSSPLLLFADARDTYSAENAHSQTCLLKGRRWNS